MEIWVVKESAKEQLETIAKKCGDWDGDPLLALASPAISLRVMPDSFFSEMRTKEGEPVDMLRVDASKLKLCDPSSFRFSFEAENRDWRPDPELRW